MRLLKMPFKKVLKGKDKGKFKSPSGKVFTKKQVEAYYATRGFEKVVRGKRK